MKISLQQLKREELVEKNVSYLKKNAGHPGENEQTVLMTVKLKKIFPAQINLKKGVNNLLFLLILLL